MGAQNVSDPKPFWRVRASRRNAHIHLASDIQSGFAALLIAFMIYIAFFDTGDWIRSARADRDVPVVFAPQK